MPTSSERIERAALDLASSLWVQAGVSGWDSRHANFALDPEALIVLTAFLGDRDPRLRDEATDWCITYGRYVSVTRLRNILKPMPDAVRENFGEFAATVNEHAPRRWPFATEPRPYTPTGRSRIDDFGRSSLIALRLRALFGVGARAEIVRVLLIGRYQEVTAAELAEDVNFTKRHVAEELEALQMGGLLDLSTVRNQHVYQLTRRAELEELVAFTRSGVSVRWPELVRILIGIIELTQRMPEVDERVRLVEVDGFLRSHQDDLRRTDLTVPQTATRTELVPRFERWAGETFERIADGDVPAYASLCAADEGSPA